MVKQPILHHIEQGHCVLANDHIFLSALYSSLLLALKERGLLNPTQHLLAEQIMRKKADLTVKGIIE